MTEQVVRGYWVSAGIAFVGMHYPTETSQRVLGSLSKELRLAAAQLGPAEWCPRSHHTELLRAIASVQRDESRAFEDLLAYGQYVGSEAANGSLKPFLLISTLKLFARKLPGLWLRDHQDDGKLESDIAQLEEARLNVQLTGIRGYDHVGIATLGWIKGTMAKFGRRGLHVKQSGWSLKHSAPGEMSGELSWS